jgi:TRAP-type C4-dicarboxylate transport system permease small subunit
LVEAKTNGDFKLNISYGGLSKSRENLDGISIGAFEMAQFCSFKYETAVVIFLLVFLATVNVLGRWLFFMPIDGYVDWVEQAMAFIAFLGIAYTKRLGGHIRMDILIGHACSGLQNCSRYA